MEKRGEMEKWNDGVMEWWKWWNDGWALMALNLDRDPDLDRKNG